MGFANRAIAAAGLGFAVSALVGCGGSGSLLSSAQSIRLSGQLEQASSALYSYQCHDAANALQDFRNDVDSLQSVNSTLIGNLDQGANTIAQLAASECPVTPPHQQTHTTTTKTTPAKTQTNTDTITTQTQTQPLTTPTQTQTQTTNTQTQTGITTTSTQTDTTPTTTTNTGTTTSPDTGGGGLGSDTGTNTSTTGTSTGDGGQGSF